MKLALKSKKTVDPTHLDPIEGDIKDEKLPPVKKHTRFNFFRFVVGIVAILLPVALFLGAVPYGIKLGSSLLQPFFKASNFTVTGSSSTSSSLKKEPSLLVDKNGVTSVLIVGIDTRAYGSKLLNTDTIILASYNHKNNEVSMISFPRDLNVNYPNTPSFGKINATYAYGERRKKGSGIEYLKQLIESISGQKIQYHVMVDLKGFTTVINQLGGIDVDVKPGFSGYYPTDRLGWMTVKVKRGVNHMDGTRALQYARIRHVFDADTYNDYLQEASDFGRARRQQKIIQAVIDKATKVETLQNTKTIFEIMGTVAKNIKINRITPEDVEAALTIMLEKGKPTSYSMVLDPGAGGGGRLIKRGAGYLYTLEPTAGRNNWSQVKSFVKDYVAAPGLVTIKKPIYVYNNGASSFSSKFKSMDSRYYYADFKNGGTPKNLPAAGVYNIGGKTSASTAKYLAAVYKLPFVEVTADISVPKPKNCLVVVVLGK